MRVFFLICRRLNIPDSPPRSHGDAKSAPFPNVSIQFYSGIRHNFVTFSPDPESGRNKIKILAPERLPYCIIAAVLRLSVV